MAGKEEFHYIGPESSPIDRIYHQSHGIEAVKETEPLITLFISHLDDGGVRLSTDQHESFEHYQTIWQENPSLPNPEPHFPAD